MNLWILRLFETLRHGRAPSIDEHTRQPPPCLARQHAGCIDQRHCANCSPTEQALRVAARHTDAA